MKKAILLFLLCFPLYVIAQTDVKYLSGAIPMHDGKVSFSTEMNIPGMTQQQIYNSLYQWAQKRYQPIDKLNARILYEKPENGNFIVGGEEYIIFSSSALSLDKTRIYYLMNIICKPEKCLIEISRIHYWYDEARKNGEKFTAEERITDKMALNKSKTKLAPIYGKFRKGTIDLKDQLFSEIQSVLHEEMVALGLSVTVTSSDSSQPLESKDSHSATANEKEQKNDIEKLIKEAVRLTITTGNEEQFDIPMDAWGGISNLYGKEVACCIIDTQKTMSNLLLTQNNQYTLTFYSAQSHQPSVIMLCKKLIQQNITGEEAQKINPKCSTEKSYNMYIGEIQK